MSPYTKINPIKEQKPVGEENLEGATKYDAGKPRVELVLGDFAPALMEVVKVGTFGAEKYSDHGWTKISDGLGRVQDAKGRHRLYRQLGEEVDPESGLLHLAHEAWNTLAELTYTIKGTGQDGTKEE